jgi:hypothetical protein
LIDARTYCKARAKLGLTCKVMKQLAFESNAQLAAPELLD